MRIGVLGAGQLGRMLAMAGSKIDIECAFFDKVEDACAQSFGRYFKYNEENLNNVLEDFLSYVDIVTFETENVSVKITEKIATIKPLLPKSQVLTICQDRLKEKKFFNQLKIPTPKFKAVTSADTLVNLPEEFDFPFVLKTTREGYDGKGQMIINNKQDLGLAWNKLNPKPLIAEEFINYDREVSIICVRNFKGDIKFYPLVENIHKNGILRFSLAPCKASSDIVAIAQNYINSIAVNFNYVGVITLELFQVKNQLYANEIAPRVHNSGHWTIEGAKTSQFENHLRAIAKMPLASTECVGSSLMVNLIGDVPEISNLLDFGKSNIHLYQKSPKPNRKLGHITYEVENLEQVETKINKLQELV